MMDYSAMLVKHARLEHVLEALFQAARTAMNALLIHAMSLLTSA